MIGKDVSFIGCRVLPIFYNCIRFLLLLLLLLPPSMKSILPLHIHKVSPSITTLMLFSWL
jgi:hypothetical protein